MDVARRYRGTSLNDNLLKGPDLFTSQLAVFLRFRKGSIGLSADIKAMYYQVRVLDEDQPALSFVWREPGSGEPPQVY